MVAKTLADELGPRGVRVNGLLPGRVAHRAGRRARRRRRRPRRRPRGGGADDPAAAATASRRSSAGSRPSCCRRRRRSSPARCCRSTAGCSARSERSGRCVVRRWSSRDRCLWRSAARWLLVGLGGLAGLRPAGPLAPLVVGEVAEAEDRQHAEEPPLQAVEEVRAVVQLRAARPARGGSAGWPGPRTGGRRSRRTPHGPRAGPISSLEIARVDWSVDRGAVAGGVDADPARDGDLAGRRGGDVGRRGRCPGCRSAIQPRSTSSDGPSAVTRGTTTSTPDGAVAGAVADDHGVVDVVRPGRLVDQPPLVVLVDRAGRARGRRRRAPAAQSSFARRPRCSPCGPRAGGTATRRATRWPSEQRRRRPRTGSTAGSAGTPRNARVEAIRGPFDANLGEPPPRLAGVTTQRSTDRYGRVATDLRVSLTDRCNLRCSYCMPAEGLDWLPDDDVLTDDEVVRLVRIGVRAARRPRGAVHRRRAARTPRPGRHRPPQPRSSTPTSRLSLTTNALGLARTAARARPPGSTGSTSASTRVRPETFLEITRRDRLARRDRRPRGRPRRRAGPGQDQRRAAARASTTTRRPSCCAGASTTATSCGSSSRCRWTPSTAGAARRWSPPTRSSSTSSASSC